MREVIVKINDKEIPMHHFVKDIFANVIDGIIDSLDDVPVDRDRKIEIKIETK